LAEFPGEFEFIARLLKPLAGHEAALGLADDAAILEPSPAKSLVLTKDMLVEGVHYLAGDPPGDIAAKALRVNLSDLAAMGATPVAYLMGISRNERQGLSWMEQFVEGLARDQATFGLSLIGGDTTATPGPMTISITALGEVPSGRALRRNGAQPGDVVLVSGTIGDACLGLGVARGEIEGDADGFLLGRYRLPTPRLPLAPLLSRYAHAAIDVSDGLVADLGQRGIGRHAELEIGEADLEHQQERDQQEQHQPRERRDNRQRARRRPEIAPVESHDASTVALSLSQLT